jgi:hypothetical protein
MARAMLIQQPRRNMTDMQTQMAVVAEDGDGATRKAVVAEDEEGNTLIILVEGEDEDSRNRAEADLRISPEVLPK